VIGCRARRRIWPSGEKGSGVLVSPGSHSSNVCVWEETQLSVWCVCVPMRFVCMREIFVWWGGELSREEADLVKTPLAL